MTDQELQNQRMYNITKYLNNCYLNKVEPSKDIMKDVDFSELSSNEIQFFDKKMGHIRSTVNENLAINCISNIPYEAYQQFVDTSWLYFEKDYDGSLFKTSIIHKNIGLIEKLHDIGLDSALNDKQTAHGYQRRCLDSILNFNFLEKREGFPVLDKDFGQRYLALVKKATSELEYFHQVAFIGEEKKPLKYAANPDWLHMATNLKSSYKISGFAKNEILTSLVSQPELLPLFEDALIILMKNNRKNLKGILGFGEIYPENEYETRSGEQDTTNILSVAFANNNFEAAKIIVDTLRLSPQDCLAAFEFNIKERVDNLTEERFENEKVQPFALLLKNYFNSSYSKFKTEFFPELDTGYLPLFVLGKDKTLKQQILDNKDTIFDTPVSEFKIVSNSGMSDSKRNLIVTDEMLKDEYDDEGEEISYYTKYNTDFTLNDSLFTAKIIDKLNEFLTTEGKQYFYPKDRKTLKNMCLNDFVIDHLLKSEKELLKSIDITSIPETYWNTFSKPPVLLHFMDTMKIKQGNKEEPIIDSDFKLLLETVKLEVELGKNTSNNTKSNKIKI
jgi:hypothetical protein